MDDLIAGRACPLCGGEGAYYGEKGGFPLRECRSGHAPILLSWQWDSAQDYEAWYREPGAYHLGEQVANGQASYWERDGDLLAASSLRASLLKALYPWQRRLCDVGCGTGSFVEIAARHGYEAEGLEPSPEMVAEAAARGRAVRVGGWQALEHRWDVVSILDVLEHLTRPVDCLRHLSRCLSPGGVLLVETPEWDCPVARHDGPLFKHIRPLQHLFLLSEGSAIELFARAGLRVDASIRPLRGSLGKIAFFLSRSGE